MDKITKPSRKENSGGCYYNTVVRKCFTDGLALVSYAEDEFGFKNDWNYSVRESNSTDLLNLFHVPWNDIRILSKSLVLDVTDLLKQIEALKKEPRREVKNPFESRLVELESASKRKSPPKAPTKLPQPNRRRAQQPPTNEAKKKAPLRNPKKQVCPASQILSNCSFFGTRKIIRKT